MFVNQAGVFKNHACGYFSRWSSNAIFLRIDMSEKIKQQVISFMLICLEFILKKVCYIQQFQIN